MYGRACLLLALLLAAFGVTLRLRLGVAALELG
jgi:hypothetical protein